MKLINRHLSEQNQGQQFKEDTRFYVTFANKLIAKDVINGINGWDAKIVKDINLNAIVNLKFKTGVLDLINIESEQKKRTKTSENISWVKNEKDVIWEILSHLKTERWFEFPEVKKNMVGEHHPYPGAIRTYEQKHGFSKWAFTNDEEVIID